MKIICYLKKESIKLIKKEHSYNFWIQCKHCFFAALKAANCTTAQVLRRNHDAILLQPVT
jgi:hypothetical protein